MKIVFLIDDDPIYVYLIRKIIQTIDNTAEVKSFPDGEIAITYLESIRYQPQSLPQTIFLDLNMPVMDGWEFLGEYSKSFGASAQNIKLYIVSSSISPDDIQQARGYDFVIEYLIKPLEKEKLTQIIG